MPPSELCTQEPRSSTPLSQCSVRNLNTNFSTWEITPALCTNGDKLLELMVQYLTLSECQSSQGDHAAAQDTHSRPSTVMCPITNSVFMLPLSLGKNSVKHFYSAKCKELQKLGELQILFKGNSTDLKSMSLIPRNPGPRHTDKCYLKNSSAP